MPVPVIAADSTRWGGTVTVRRRALDTTTPIRKAMELVPGNPNRVAWIASYTTPGLGVLALPLAIVEGELSGVVPPTTPAEWQLRANGDFLELDVRIDSDLAIRPFSCWWLPSFKTGSTGQQFVSVWEYVRIHGGETPQDGA